MLRLRYWLPTIAALQIADMVLSAWLFTHHVAREGNPIAAFAWVSAGLLGLFIVKVVFLTPTGVALSVASRLVRSLFLHPLQLLVLLLFCLGVSIYLVANDVLLVARALF
jgi:Domain of unknown function (DUF5658)